MNLIDDSFILKCQAGLPIFYDDICALYPETLRNIAEVGYNKFQSYLQLILTKKPILEDKPENEEMNALLDALTDFDYFLMLTQMDKDFNELAREAFYFFCRENVIFSIEPAQIVVGPISEKHILGEEQFAFFQTMIKRIYFLDEGGKDEIIIYDTDSPLVKKMKKRQILNRERVAKAKAKQRAKEGTDISFSDLVGSFAIGTGISLNEVYNLTYYAFQDQLKRMGWREEYNTNSRAALAGAKIKKEQLKYWIRSIKNNDTK